MFLSKSDYRADDNQKGQTRLPEEDVNGETIAIYLIRAFPEISRPNCVLKKNHEKHFREKKLCVK